MGMRGRVEKAPSARLYRQIARRRRFFLQFRVILHREITFFFYTKRSKSQNFLAPTGNASCPPRPKPTLICGFPPGRDFDFGKISCGSQNIRHEELPHGLIFFMCKFLADLLDVEVSTRACGKKKVWWSLPPDQWRSITTGCRLSMKPILSIK